MSFLNLQRGIIFKGKSRNTAAGVGIVVVDVMLGEVEQILIGDALDFDMSFHEMFHTIFANLFLFFINFMLLFLFLSKEPRYNLLFARLIAQN